MAENIDCFSSYPDIGCPENCPGPKNEFRTRNGDRYLIQLCMNDASFLEPPEAINFSGMGPDVLVFHQPERPSDEAVRAAAEAL